VGQGERQSERGDEGAVTVGIDIGTGSVKAVAVAADGTVVARARVGHPVHAGGPDHLEHDVNRAWRRNVRRALREVGAGLDVRGVNVAAMVPSLAAVNGRGAALTPGLLSGDQRGGGVVGADPASSGELLGFLRWCAREAPGARGYWPAQAVANHALCGVGAIDSVTAMTAVPLFDYTQWDAAVAAEAGARVDQLPLVVSGSDPAGTIEGTEVAGATADGTIVGGGTIDAFGEQLVAGADHAGDVLVICGSTLITWAVVEDWRELAGLWTVPHTAPGLTLVGGPSNAGGLFLDWADRLVVDASDGPNLAEVPVWLPYPRGERTPLHDPDRRAALVDLHLGTGPAEVRRAAFEAAGFVVRHHLDLAGVTPRRIVATGGGVRAAGWIQAMADATRVPVDVVAVPEGAALGAAFLARVTAGLEDSAAEASRWARVGHRVEPDDEGMERTVARYRRFRELTGPPGPPGGV
jgi:xylulokinase